MDMAYFACYCGLRMGFVIGLRGRGEGALVCASLLACGFRVQY